MYNVLSMSWDQMFDTDYLFKSNAPRRTIEVHGSELYDVYSEDSEIIIMYNMYTGDPYLLCERIKGAESIDESSLKSMPDDFVYHIDDSKVGSRKYIDIVLTRRDLYNAILEEESKT